MIRIVEAPNEIKIQKTIKLFLAGGITDVEDWQSYVIDRLLEDSESKLHDYLTNVVVFNPRRGHFTMNDVDNQIEWEYNKLKEADVICFWFAGGTPNPIVLFEYGNFGFGNIPVVVGVDVGGVRSYERVYDVEIQTKLRRPDRIINYNLKDFYYNILKEIKKLNKK